MSTSAEEFAKKLIHAIKNAYSPYDGILSMVTDRDLAVQGAALRMAPENLARLFHENYERLAPDYSYETRKDSAVAWDDVPLKNQNLMVATAIAVLQVIVPSASQLALDKLLKDARREEARWWANYVTFPMPIDKHGICNCGLCERLRSLHALPLTSEPADSGGKY